MLRIGETGLLHSAHFTRAMLVLVLAYGIVGGITAARHTARTARAAASLPAAQASIHPVTGGAARFFPGSTPSLDRIAAAVDAAESDYGTNPRMRRADPNGPQGPMQLTAAAAAEIGGGDRFDLNENLALGRAYFAYMYRRYGSWADAIAAYNWGPGHMDAWIHAGRRADRLPAAVARYTGQVLLASASPGVQLPDPNVKALRLARGPSPRTRQTARHEGLTGTDGPSIPAGAGSIGMTPSARLPRSRGREEHKNVLARPHASARAPGTQARELSPAKASRSKRHGPSQEMRGRPRNRVAGIAGPRLIPARLLRTRGIQPRRRAARIASGLIPAGRRNAKTRTALPAALAVHPGGHGNPSTARTRSQTGATHARNKQRPIATRA
jgi:Transglycosylase SLT domain